MSKKNDATKNKLKIINSIFGVNEAYEMPGKVLEIVQNFEKAQQIYLEMLKFHDFDLCYDWFYEYFQEEHADRKNNKQDFTPVSIAKLLHACHEVNDGIIYEPACGTGGIIIQHWDKTRKQYGIFNFNPMDRLYICEELSSRTIPFLLFNLAIRGVNAIVAQTNVITRETKNFYHVFNEKNENMAFSSVAKINNIKAIEILKKINLEYKTEG